MGDSLNHAGSNTPPGTEVGIRVSIDGRVVDLALQGQQHVLALHAHLESIALREGKVLSNLQIDASTSVLPHAPIPKITPPPDPQGATDELSRHFLRTLRRQLAQLQGKIERVMLLVLVNNATINDRLWSEVQHDLRGAVLTLRLLQEFNAAGPSPTPEPATGYATLSTSFTQLHEVWQVLETFAAAGDAIGLSNQFEQALLPWVRGLDERLATLDNPGSQS